MAGFIRRPHPPTLPLGQIAAQAERLRPYLAMLAAPHQTATWVAIALVDVTATNTTHPMRISLLKPALLITGNGLKDVAAAARAVVRPPAIAPRIEEVKERRDVL